MRLSLCNEVVRTMTVEAQAAYAAALGYDGLEIAPFTLDPEQPHRLEPARIARVRRAVEAEGLVVSGLHWLLSAPTGVSITSTDPDVAARTADVMARLVDLCASLGGRYLVHGSPPQRVLEDGREAEGRARALDHFAAVAERAARAGVTYCVEPLSPDQTRYCTTLAEADEIVGAVSSPAFRAMIDTSSASLAESDPIPDLIERHLPSGLIAHVHFNDPNRRGPGEGELRFRPILKTLVALGYDGWIGIEPFVYEPDGAAVAARAIGYIRALEETL